MKKILIVFLFAAAAFGQTKSIVPRATHQGYLGTTSKSWLGANIDTIHAAIIFGAADYNTLTNKPTIPGQYDSASVAGAVAWGSVTGKPSTFTPSAHTQDWSTITNQPTIPAAYDSATKYDTTYAPAKTMALNAAIKKWNDSASTKLGASAKAASATIADSTNGGAAKLNGKAAALYQDSTQLVRTARVIKLMVDSSRVVSATRTPIYLPGILATDRVWVDYADSTSGVRKRGGGAGVCKANSLVVFTDTTVATVNYMIFR